MMKVFFFCLCLVARTSSSKAALKNPNSASPVPGPVTLKCAEISWHEGTAALICRDVGSGLLYAVSVKHVLGAGGDEPVQIECLVASDQLSGKYIVSGRDGAKVNFFAKNGNRCVLLGGPIESELNPEASLQISPQLKPPN